VVLDGCTSVSELALTGFVIRLDLFDLVHQVLVLLLLHFCFVFEPLVLNLNVAFNLADVLLGRILCFFLIVFQLFEVPSVDSLLLSLDVLSSLGFNLCQLLEQHLEPVLLVLDLLLLLIVVAEVEVQVFFLLRHLLDLHRLLCEALISSFFLVLLGSLESLFDLLLLLADFFLLSLEQQLVAFNVQVFLFNLRRESTSDLHHVEVVVVHALLHLLNVLYPAHDQFNSLTETHIAASAH